MSAIVLVALSSTACSLFSKPAETVVIQWATPDARLLEKCQDPPLPGRSLSDQMNDERTSSELPGALRGAHLSILPNTVRQ